VFPQSIKSFIFFECYKGMQGHKMLKHSSLKQILKVLKTLLKTCFFGGATIEVVNMRTKYCATPDACLVSSFIIFLACSLCRHPPPLRAWLLNTSSMMLEITKAAEKQCRSKDTCCRDLSKDSIPKHSWFRLCISKIIELGMMG